MTEIIILETDMMVWICLISDIDSTWRQALWRLRRHYATGRKVAGSIPDEIIEFFN
jgi:hypothetical protein